MQFTVILALLGAAAAEYSPIDPIAPQHQRSLRAKKVQIDTSRERGTAARVVHAEEIVEPGAAWLRVNFEEQFTSLTAGATLVITSRLDGAVQHLNAQRLKQWGYSTAYFNGDAVSVEVIAKPGMGVLQFQLGNITVGEQVKKEGLGTICGSTDKRTPSSELRSGRHMSVSGGGCTAWIIDDAQGCFLSCAHCSPSAGSVVQFNVPPSLPSGTVQHPPPSDQYAVDGESLQMDSRYSQGNDWAYFGTFSNTETGLAPRSRNKNAAYKLFTNKNALPGPAGQRLRITGYGVATGVVSQVQQTHLGTADSYTSISTSTYILRHRVDTTGGNSGSAIEIETGNGAGYAVAIHGYGGCTSRYSGSTSSNSGTSIQNPQIVAALANPKGVCARNYVDVAHNSTF